MLAALLRPLFNANDGDAARELVGDALERTAQTANRRSLRYLEEAEDDLLAF